MLVAVPLRHFRAGQVDCLLQQGQLVIEVVKYDHLGMRLGQL